jgi:N-acetyl-1-D-myo-inositol-2-amino-2-deoxy-alpha-D-glucopyranoside deacetylase
VTGLLDGIHVEGRAPRLLFVHAHPDDETLATGVAIAHHVARGDDVHVLTCTLGEEGEVIPAHLAHLEGAPGDPLGAHRREELRGAMEVLGVTSHVLGEGDGSDAGHPSYRDSGMAGSAAAAHPRAWAGADLADAAAAVRAVLDEVRPDVVVTYDATGGYRHPDHVRTHEATLRAVASCADAPVLYAVLTPLSWALEDRQWLAEHVPTDQGLVVLGPDDPFMSSVVPDEVVTHRVVDPTVVPVQARALLAHETQVVVGDGWYALSNHVVSRLAGREGFARLDAASGRPTSEDPA